MKIDINHRIPRYTVVGEIESGNAMGCTGQNPNDYIHLDHTKVVLESDFSKFEVRCLAVISEKDAEIARLTEVIWTIRDYLYEPNDIATVIQKAMYPDACKPCDWPGWIKCEKCEHYPALDEFLSKIDTPMTRAVKKQELGETK